MSINQEQMLQAIYDTLFSSFTAPPAGMSLEGASQAKQTYLTLQWPGLQINPADFANPYSPSNPEGSQAVVENFSAMVNKVQALNPITSPNGNTVSQIYQAVLEAQITPPPSDPRAEQRYKEALDFLKAKGTDYDDDGKPIQIVVDSPIYRSYLSKKAAYSNAVVSLMANYSQYKMENPEDQRKWSLLGPSLNDGVSTAWKNLVAAQKDKVESALAVLGQASNNQVGKIFDDAKMQFTALARGGIVDPTSKYWRSYALPSNWFAPSASDIWTEVTINSGSTNVSEHSDFSSISSGGCARWGMWSLGGSFSKEDSHQSMDTETTNLAAKFKFARIDIQRPWLNFLLFSMGGWSLNEMYKPGKLSNGTKDQAGTAFPLLPTSFIAVRDLSISADWGKQDASMISSKLSAGGSFGWGPFALGGSYSSGSSTKKFKSDFDHRTISNNGLQIIGWVNTVVPNCPPPLS